MKKPRNLQGGSVLSSLSFLISSLHSSLPPSLSSSHPPFHLFLSASSSFASPSTNLIFSFSSGGAGKNYCTAVGLEFPWVDTAE
jgi:hypothetical protein